MAIIKIKCPDCGKPISVNIKTIDKLKKENAELKSKISALENAAAVNDVLRGIFK